jgi:ABC-2 type transport system permease protein
MRLSQALIVASKDLSVFTKKRNIIYSVFIIPMIVGILFPFVERYILQKSSIPASEFAILLPAFSFFFVILAGLTPSTIASYTVVGEKVEKSFEPLLATPTTDGEILLGKGIAAVLPPLGAILAGSVVFMVLTDIITVGRLGYYFYPNWDAALVFFLMVPLATVLSVEWSVFISSRVSDVRIAQQLGTLMILPFAGMYVAGELNILQLGDATTLLAISGIIAIIDLLLMYPVRATFQREEILTRWK